MKTSNILFNLLLFFNVLLDSQCEEICSSSSPSISDDRIDVVVAALGGLNVDGKAENLTWIPSELTKPLYLYDRTNTSSPFYINTRNGNECLTYTKYIIDHYHNLPEAVIFIHADAPRHCPTITNVLQKSNDEILSQLNHPTQQIRGYISLSKVFLNHSYEYLQPMNLGILELSNEILTVKCEHHRHSLHNHNDENDENNPCDIPSSNDLPQHTTTYSSGSFIVSRRNILSVPLEFYQKLYKKLFDGPQYVDATCGALEYLWTTIWGGKPFAVLPDRDSWCGPLYYADIMSNYGFLFYQSDDGSVESGYLPDKYYGYIYNRQTQEIKNGFHLYPQEDELEELEQFQE